MSFTPKLHPDEPDAGQKPKRRRKRLRTIAMLPSLLTLGNLFFGFLAIYCCGMEMHDLGAKVDSASVLTLHNARIEAILPTYLAVGVLMLILSMICDSLDGRVARMTGQASKFGEQLDSLADAVSFGVAPAFLMVTMLRREVIQWNTVPFGYERFNQAVLLIGAVYVMCAVLRLARFNVETSMEEASHHGFRGLPSPGAAAAVISLIFLHEHLDMGDEWVRSAAAITKLLPVCTLVLALLMVSRIPYVHAMSVLMRRRPFGHVVLVVMVGLLLLLYPSQMTALLSCSFALSGPVLRLYRRLTGRPTQGAPAAQTPPPADISSVSPTERKAQ